MIETDFLDSVDFVPGWQESPEEVLRVQGMQPIGTFEDSPAGQISLGELPEVVSLHDAAIKVLGSPLPIRNQGAAGTCVSFGIVRAIELSLLWQIAFGGAPYSFPARGLATEPIYGGSRVEVGQRRIGRGDGSIVGWGAEFAKRWGICARQPFPDYKIDLSTYSIPLSREWGWNGVPDGFEPTLKLHPVQAVAKVTTVEGWIKALAQGYAIAEGSNRLLATKRGASGIITTYRGGGHCMASAGYVTINGKRYIQIDNSWGGGSHTGPTHPKFPYDGGGLIPEEDAAAMVSQGDTWALSSVVGFPTRDVDWSQIG